MSISSIGSNKARQAGGTRRMACTDAGTGCGAVFEGNNDDKIVTAALHHLAQDHGLTLTADLAARVRGMIRPVGADR